MAENIVWVSSSARSGGNGSESSPYATIQAAVNAAGPGTTIKVKAGVYTENVVIRQSGASGSPITLVSADGPGRAEIRPASSSAETIRISAANYIVIDGFKLTGPSLANVIEVSSADSMRRIPSYITIKNNDIRPAAGDGVKISQGDHISILDNIVVGSSHEQGIDAVGVTHSIISGNTVSGVMGGAAIQVKGGSVDVEISYNTIEDTGRWGILVGGSTNLQNMLPGTSNYEAKSIRVIGNEVDGSNNQALRVMGAQDVEISGNWFHGVASSRIVDILSAGDTHSDWASRNVTFEGNSFERSDWLTVESGQGSYVTTGNRVDGAAPSGWTDPVGYSQPTLVASGTPTAPTSTATARVRDDFAETSAGTPVEIDLMRNDDPFNWSKALVATPANGVISQATEKGWIKYTPKQGFVGTDTFKYTLSDDSGHSSTATVTVVVEKSGTQQYWYDLSL